MLPYSVQRDEQLLTQSYDLRYVLMWCIALDVCGVMYSFIYIRRIEWTKRPIINMSTTFKYFNVFFYFLFESKYKTRDLLKIIRSDLWQNLTFQRRPVNKSLCLVIFDFNVDDRFSYQFLKCLHANFVFHDAPFKQILHEIQTSFVNGCVFDDFLDGIKTNQ